MRDWKCTPRKHQLAHYLRERDLTNRALWWDQGTGKTAEVLAMAAHNYRTGKINAMLVLAPPGVESNWINDEIPKHWPDDLGMQSFCWSSRRSTTKRYMQAYADFLEPRVGIGNLRPWSMKILCMSYPAMMTDRGAKAARKFLDDHDVFYVIDESTFIKTPDTQTTKRVVASAKYAKVRRALNGTPVEDSPLALYTQVKWVDNNIWLSRGISTYGQFKVMFGIWEQRMGANGKMFPHCAEYQNLDLLNTILLEAGERILKDDVLDLPPKSYSKIYFDLTPKQRKIYTDLKILMSTTLDSGDVIDAELAIVRMVRFQQIASGYFPRDEDTMILAPIDTKNPRIAALSQVLDQTFKGCIIWAKYNADIDAIVALLEKRGESFVVYDGRTSPEDREIAKRRFQDGEVQYFVSKPRAAGRGLTLTKAKTVIYYNNGFSAEDRKQSEDRAHRIGQEDPVLYIDIIARDTIDEHILAVLRRKKKTSATVTGDQLQSWI